MIESLITLYLAFFKIGLFGFGGGYAMISLIQEELAKHGWIGMETFVDIIAIAEMTPGPIAINSGTFVGFESSAFFGSLTATTAVISPSFILVLILAHYFNKIKDSNYINAILKYLRPAIIGLIVTAAFTIAKANNISLTSSLITIAVVGIMVKTDLHPILIIFSSGLAGAVIFA